MAQSRPLRPVEVVSSADQGCTFPGKLLNGETISGYLRLVERRSCNRPDLPYVLATNTYLFASLKYSPVKREEAYQRARRHYKGFSPLDFDMLLVPIHEPRCGREGHWWLMVADIRKREILAFDSLPGRPKRADLEILWNYLLYEEESAGKRQPSGWKLVENPTCPTQLNAVDCGVFVCAFAEHISAERALQDMSVDTHQWRKDIASALRQNRLPDERMSTSELFRGEVDWTFEELADELARLAPPIPEPMAIDAEDDWELCEAPAPPPSINRSPASSTSSFEVLHVERRPPTLLDLVGMTAEEMEGVRRPPPIDPPSPGSFLSLSPGHTLEAELGDPEVPLPSTSAAGASGWTAHPAQDPAAGPSDTRPKRTRGKRRTMKVQIPGTNQWKRINIRRLGLIPFKRPPKKD